MCAINPKHEWHFTLSVYTSLDITKEQFQDLVISKVLELEARLNSDARLRWHVKDGG